MYQRMHTTIRMGAAEWSVNVDGAKVDMRRMTRKERNEFHAMFMAVYRLRNPYNPKRRATNV